MDVMIKTVANALGVDVSTMWKSIFSGTSSTGVGIYITNINNFDWHFEMNLVSLFWGAVSCIVLTILSLAVSDLYKWTKKKLKRK